jgi:hypothetical protein
MTTTLAPSSPPAACVAPGDALELGGAPRASGRGVARPPRRSRSMRAPASRRVIEPAAVRRPRPGRALTVRGRDAGGALLGRYLDVAARPREVVACAGASGSVLVIDRDAITLGSRRLVGHLPLDEPPGNARLLCALYLADPTRGHCRAVLAGDLEAAPFPEVESEQGPSDEQCAQEREAPEHETLIDARGRVHRIELARSSQGRRELRWHTRLSSPPEEHSSRRPARVASLRDVVGAMESYEPARAMTRRALARHRDLPNVALGALQGELRRVASSRIVLNRGLREALVTALARDGLTLSEIALRCGRVKRDARGHRSGEGTWVARRVGLVPDSGREAPSPWIHSDVLALIARRGLGLSPHEVELG